MLKLRIDREGDRLHANTEGNELTVEVGIFSITAESTKSPSDLEYEKAFAEWRKTFDANCARVEAGGKPSFWRSMSTALKNGRPILVRSWPSWLSEPHMPFTVFYDADLESWCDDSEDPVDFSAWAGGIESFTWHMLPE